MSYDPRLVINDSRLTTYDLRLRLMTYDYDYRLPTTYYLLPATDYRLPTTDYRLPITASWSGESTSLRWRPVEAEPFIPSARRGQGLGLRHGRAQHCRQVRPVTDVGTPKRRCTFGRYAQLQM